jgi:hypothetical protein
MADADLGAARPQGQHPARFLGVGPRHRSAAVQQDPGNARHAGAADADHVHPLQLGRQLMRGHRGLRARRALIATSSATCATFCAASRWPTSAAAAVIAASLGPSVSSPATVWAT